MKKMSLSTSFASDPRVQSLSMMLNLDCWRTFGSLMTLMSYSLRTGNPDLNTYDAGTIQALTGCDAEIIGDALERSGFTTAGILVDYTEMGKPFSEWATASKHYRSSKRSPPSVPTMSEVEQFFRDNGLTTDAKAFYTLNKRINKGFKNWQEHAFHFRDDKPTQTKRKRLSSSSLSDEMIQEALDRADRELMKEE